jgi:hypothetical protein
LKYSLLLCFVFSLLTLRFLTAAGNDSQSTVIWVEGENPTVNKMNRHPWWYDKVSRDQLSGGDLISNFSKERAGEAEYRFSALRAGEYEFWVRANPFQSRLSYSLNGGAETLIDLNREKRDEINIAADGKPDLRFIAWSKVGMVALRGGENSVRFRMTSENNNHGYLDCFVFSLEPFQPRGVLKPGEIVAAEARELSENREWFSFDPKQDDFGPDSAIDLRFLNEKFAGENGFIGVKDGQFVHNGNGEPVRFWGVNGPPQDLKGEELRRCARMLAKHGVNMVRVHGGYFDANGEVDMGRVKHAIEIVEAMKAEGIYTHLSIYFVLWLSPKPGTPWLQGYDGVKKPFAALLFNPDFQAKYRAWWTSLLTTPSPASGKRLIDDPAVASLEMQNEDSFFFWSFKPDEIPDAQMRILEKQFGDWLVQKYGSLDAAIAKWGGLKAQRDAPAEGRVSFRPLWNMAHEKTPRDQDTCQFLLETQMRFYSETRTFLRKLGFKGPITASNWITASPEVLGPLEKLSYTTGDFIDRHGYFGCNEKGEGSAWSVRDGHTYSDRSALRMDAEEPGKPRQIVNPVMDPHYDNMPSMISETTWNRPNRFRSEAPLFYAAYGALQLSDAIIHFALDSGDRWTVKPGFFMQPWTLMTPAMIGQFPAAALIFRRGLVTPGEVLAEVSLNREDLIHLKGTTLPQDASLDELRLKEMPQGLEFKPGQRLDPLLHYAGRTNVKFTTGGGSVKLSNTSKLIDHDRKTVASSTGELNLDYGNGVLTINAARAQGVSGMLNTAGVVQTKDISIISDLDLGHIIAVSLDGLPLATSQRILLQVMSEEKTTDYQTVDVSAGVKRIMNIGRNPWLVKGLKGTVVFKRPDAARMRVTALDCNGYPAGNVGGAEKIMLQPKTIYYLICR